jgi:uncharacterized coiled-coil DUF342 family protein
MSKLIQKLATHFEKQLKKVANENKLAAIWNDVEALKDYLLDLPPGSPEAVQVKTRIQQLSGKQQIKKLTPQEEAEIEEQLKLL